jgi:glycogen debranching enzyme
MPDRPPLRSIPAPAPTIIPATDLGNVDVAKEGNLYLLTDPRGDVRLDGRGLGLYDLDTRILSASMLRLNGSQPTLLRGPDREGGVDTIQLTNPELRRNPADKRAASTSLARRELSLTRTRRLDGELNERVTIESYSATTEALQIDVGFGVDMADIFEVRGYQRTSRGTLCPIELYDDRVVFTYDALDGRRRTTTVTLEGAQLDSVTDQETWPGASVLASWRTRLRPGRRVTFEWTVTYTIEAPDGVAASASPPSSRAKRREEMPFVVPRIRSDHELLDRTLARSIVDLQALRNDGPREGQHYLAAGIPWFATLFGRDSLIAALETVAFIPSLALATLDVLAGLQATTDDPWHDAEPGKILHELRTGEMAFAGETPHDAYYGSID